METLNEVLPQDIVLLLKMTTNSKITWQNVALSQSLQVSGKEITESIERCIKARLLDQTNQEVNIAALQEFLVKRIKDRFPAQPGLYGHGIPTAFSASPIKEHFYKGTKEFVWETLKGTVKGQTIEPLYRTVPEIIKNDSELYELLVIVDALRIGKSQEIEIATNELAIKFAKYSRN